MNEALELTIVELGDSKGQTKGLVFRSKVEGIPLLAYDSYQ